MKSRIMKGVKLAGMAGVVAWAVHAYRAHPYSQSQRDWSERDRFSGDTDVRPEKVSPIA